MSTANSSGSFDVSAYNVTESIDIHSEARVDIKFSMPFLPQLQHESSDRKIRRAFYDEIKVQHTSNTLYHY